MTTPPVKPLHIRFGKLLREHRTAQRATQLALGRLVHVSADAVAIWEKGRSIPADEATARDLDAYLHADGVLLQAWIEADNPTGQPTAPDDSLSAVSLLASSAQDAAQFGTWAEVVNTGAVTITTLTARVRNLVDRALAEPPAAIVTEAAAINHTLFD